MYCVKCGECMEDAGGSQMKGCCHFLCIGCIVDTVKAAETCRFPCEGYKGIYRCTGYLKLKRKELKCMVPDKVYRKFIRRVEAAAERRENGEENDEEKEHKDDEAFANLNLTDEEKSCGWAHKVAWIDDLVRNVGCSFEEATDHLNLLPIIENRSVINCSICMDDVSPGDGVILKDCLHMFCKGCLGGYIRASETSVVECPAPDCDEPLKVGEVAALVSKEEVQRHFEQLSLKEAAATMPNVAHCLTPNCIGFVVAEQGLTVFQCPVCRAQNCVACKVIHAGSCAEYKQRIADDQNRNVQRENEMLSENLIRNNLNQRKFMPCPKCNIVIEKNGGCPNMICHNRGCGHRFVWTGVPA